LQQVGIANRGVVDEAGATDAGGDQGQALVVDIGGGAEVSGIDHSDIVDGDVGVQPEFGAHRLQQPARVALAVADQRLRPGQASHQRQRVLALAVLEVPVAGAHRQAVRLADGRATNHLHREG
jgi:hypothetical protein